MIRPAPSGKSLVLQKIKRYCAYQERSHWEVKEKLYTLGVWKKDMDPILAQLIEENYLNEERFAIAFSGGKFRTRQWGRVKIKYALRQKQVSDHLIQKAMDEIDVATYQKTLLKLATSKWKLLKEEKQIFARRSKLKEYLIHKGYERNLIDDVVKELGN
jgi:regulatory protein